MADPAIRMEHVTRDFEHVRALDDVSIEVPAGIIFGFLGPNGSGKTTTIRLLLGLLQPTSGHARVLGYDTRTDSEAVRSRTGALLEHNGLYERLSAEDNLDFYARIWHMPAATRHERVRAMLTHLGFWDRRNEKVGTWSRGMKQKLAVGRALLHQPPLIFLDEPTSGLDPVAAAALREDLLELVKREGVTVFLTTHNLAEAERMCALVGVIRKGAVLAVAPPDELRTRTGGPQLEIVGRGFSAPVVGSLLTMPEVASAEAENGRLRVDLRGEASAAPIVRRLVNEGAEIEEVRRGTATLEEAFLALMEEPA